jgi:hypothetical protein
VAPHCFQCGPDPDPEPGSHYLTPDLGRDPGQTLLSQNVEFLHLKDTLCREINIQTYLDTKVFLKGWKSVSVDFGKFSCS